MRCSWVGNDERMIAYHDHEWGIRSHDEAYLFRQLMLECQVAGLSWAIVLNKRDAFDEAFDNFDPNIMALYDDNKVSELMNNTAIVRNRLKIKAMITNAQAYLAMCEEGLRFDTYFSNDANWLSKDLKCRGFKFVGPTTIVAYQQAVGIRNDHEDTCFMRRDYE